MINFIKSFILDDANMIINKFDIQQMEDGLSKKKKLEKNLLKKKNILIMPMIFKSFINNFKNV